MIKNKNFLVSYKILFGLLGLSAIATELIVLVHRNAFMATNFFSFFTIEANLFAAIILIVSALATKAGKQTSTLALLRGAATLYMVTVGIVFPTLLAGIENATLTAVPWDNIVLHYILPVALLIDWLIDPVRQRLSFRRATVWLTYPIAYVIYSLVRGNIANWYPYPFLDPAKHGYAGVAITSVGIAVVVLALTWLLVRIVKKPATQIS